ncbi:MAG TPA: glycoside hydrolase domain-containing protein [Longimicrobium sp.]|jgi:hypothetical protein
MYHAAFQPLPASGVTRDTLAAANVVRLVRDFAATIPRTGYVVPTAEQTEGMVRCATLLMRGTPPGEVSAQAAPLGYEAFGFYDHVMDRMLSVLRPVLPVASGTAPFWGLYVFSPAAGSRVVVQAPHPLFDLHSDLTAAQAFQGGDAVALFVAGAHRHAGGTAPPLADPARYAPSVFNEIHRVALAELKPAAVVQFHGYDGEPSAVNVIVSAGLHESEVAGSPAQVALVEAVKAELRGETLHRRLDQPGAASATTLVPNGARVEGLMGEENEQRKTMRALGSAVPFLHLEVHDTVRCARPSDAWNVRATWRLALSVMDAVHKALGQGRPAEKPFPMLGFDRNEYPGRTAFDAAVSELDGAMATWIHHSPFGFVGYHLDAPGFLAKGIDRAQRWTGRRRRLQMLGWNVKPLFFGNLYPFEGASDLTAAQGGEGAAHAAAAEKEALAEGFAAGTVVYLDVENTFDPDAAKQPNLRRYVSEWLETFAVNETGYRPGVYCSYLSAPAISAIAPNGTVFWVHNVSCPGPGRSPGCRVGPPPPLADSGFKDATVWQYAKAPIDYPPDFAECGRGTELGSGYIKAAPAGSDPTVMETLDVETCWTPPYGSLVQWTAEVDLDVAAADPVVKPLRIPFFLVPIWFEATTPTGRVIFRFRIGIGGTIIVRPPRGGGDPGGPIQFGAGERLRMVGEGVVSLAVAAIAAWSTRRPVALAAPQLRALAGAKFSAALTGRIGAAGRDAAARPR